MVSPLSGSENEHTNMTILGSLVLHSDRPVPEFEIPELEGLTKREGQHINAKYNGSYREYFDLDPLEVLVPQRYKRMSVIADPHVRDDIAAYLTALDSKFEGTNQQFKLQVLMNRFDGEWTASVNVSHTGADGIAKSGAFYVMNKNTQLFMTLVFDSTSGSVQLVWSTFDLKASLRKVQAMQYSFISLHSRRRRPVFVPSQALCSRWWRWNRGFGADRYGLIRAANALEVMLYRNSTLPTSDNGLRRNTSEA